jgi:hypothetical protein
MAPQMIINTELSILRSECKFLLAEQVASVHPSDVSCYAQAEEQEEAGEHSILRSFIIFTPHPTLIINNYKIEVNEIGGTRSTRGKYVQIFGRKT